MLTNLLLGAKVAGQQPPSKAYEFINGRWFNGRSFTSKKFYSIGGVLTSSKPARIDSTIDLTGKYVIPPFGEAHNHNVENSSRIDETIRMYLQDGIFYVKNPNILPRARVPLLGKINIPTSIDVVFANGGLTGSGGHPIGIVRRNIERGIWSEADGEGAFYFTIDSQADLDRKWESIKAGRPDFIKTFLLYSEEYARRKDDPAYFAWKGLDPALLPEIVRRAHRDGLRVSTHIESAVDFHNALVAGVDEINHMPGFRREKEDAATYQNPSRFEITEQDARLAARRGVFIVTTLGAPTQTPAPADLQLTVDNLHTRNLQMLKRHGVRIAIGSDNYRQTSAQQATYLLGLRTFDNLTLLKMWCETTAAAIFPNRRIGRLKNGYEASFLVLRGDPIQDFMNAQRIELRVKQGEILSLRN